MKSETSKNVEPPSRDENSTSQTARIQNAIDEAAAHSGGTVFIGAGTWRVSTLFLRSGIRLHLEQGAVLQAETDLALYPPQITRVSNKDQSSYHLIYADDCDDIALEGEGVIDGQDTEFWTRAQNEEERPYGIFDFYVTGERISPLIQILHCRRVRVEGTTIQRSPGWTLHAFDCDEVHIRNIRIRNHLMGPNADGITINGCRNAFVRECDVITGDDAIGIKATNSDISCRGVVVSDCIAQTNCGAFILGAETLGGIYDVTFNNCVARASLRLIAIEMWDAGHVENIVFNNIVGSTLPQAGVTCERPIYMDIQQFNRPLPELGYIRNVICSNVICTTRGRIVLTAQDGAQLENITLRDVHLDVPEIEDPQVVVPAARSMQNSNFNPHTRAARAAVVADNITGLHLSNVSVRWPEEYSGEDIMPMHALCLRRVQEAEVLSPRLQSNQPELARQITPE
jgi:hypothetical protein